MPSSKLGRRASRQLSRQLTNGPDDIATAVANMKIGDVDSKMDHVPLPVSLVEENLRSYEEDAFRRLRARDEGADLKNPWKLAGEKKGVKVYQGYVEGEAQGTLKTVGIIDCHADELAEYLWDPDNNPQYDDMTKYVHTIQQLGEQTEFRHNMCKGVVGIISKRDFVVASSHYLDQETGIHYTATRSFNLPGHEPEHGVVRAKMLLGGFIVRPVPGEHASCELTTIIHIDLSGNIPAFAMNFMGVTAPLAVVERIKKNMLKKQTQHNIRSSWW